MGIVRQRQFGEPVVFAECDTCQSSSLAADDIKSAVDRAVDAGWNIKKIAEPGMGYRFKCRSCLIDKATSPNPPSDGAIPCEPEKPSPEPQETPKRGRPSIYTPEIAQTICERLAEGETLKQICRDPDLPSDATVRGWALEDREGFFSQYARAREIGYMGMADEIVDISDDGTNDYVTKERQDGSQYEVVDQEHIQRSRLRVDTRKWLLSKALPKKYGDKLEAKVEHEAGQSLQDIMAEIAGTSRKMPKEQTDE